MIFTADRRRIALPAICVAIDKKMTAADAGGEVGERLFRFGAGSAGERFAGVRLRAQGTFQPTRCNIEKIRRDTRRYAWHALLGPMLRKHVVEGRLQALAAERGADKIFVLDCRGRAEFELIIDHPHSVIFAVDAIQATADKK